LEATLHRGRAVQSVTDLPPTEQALAAKDPTLGQVISAQSARWPSLPTEDVIWGLVRIVMAQQVSTLVACKLAERAKTEHPHLLKPSPRNVPDAKSFRALGLSQRRAQCCSEILIRSAEIRSRIQIGQTWEQTLSGIKGIGPWTIAVFSIMVLREPDVLPLKDVGLERAIANVYGWPQDVEKLGEKWRPFRSVACWYLWRTLGNEQLG
jgi:DNA-3-methyladenine glycosylase II